MGDDGIISGSETATALKLEDGDQIHVFSGSMGNMVMRNNVCYSVMPLSTVGGALLSK